jgi:tryptophanyl-tRNA synthetase
VEFAGTQFSSFKARLADLAVERLAPINAEMRRLQADPGYIDGILRRGAERARAIVEPIMVEVHRRIGLLDPQA